MVWERYTGDWLRTSVSSYWYKADNLITLRATDDPNAFLGVTYVNEGEVRAKGLEFEAQMRLWRGAEGHMSYALQEAIDQATGATLPNSPRQMGKARVSAPLFGAGSSLAVEVLGIGRRQTVSGNWAGAAATANVTLTKPIGQSLELFGSQAVQGLSLARLDRECGSRQTARLALLRRAELRSSSKSLGLCRNRKSHGAHDPEQTQRRVRKPAFHV